jgi:hypothetical protein
MKRMCVAIVCFVVLGVMAQAATITTQAAAPAATSVAQLLTCSTDTFNVNGTAVASGDNDGSTYVANDRATQGQTFTLTGGGVLNSIWVKHVSWTTFLSNGTWASFADGTQITVRVCSVSGTALTVLRSEVAAMSTGSGFSSNGDSGTGKWLHIVLATPVVLGAGTYAFDLTSYSPWFEMDGLKAGPYAGGDAYTANPKEATTMTVHTGQDRTFVLDLTTDIGNDSPANGATNIPIARTSPANDLVFTVYKASIAKVDVQFGTENDPNLTSKPANKIVSNLVVTPGQYTVNLESLAADLSNDKTYYWKVIGYEPNALAPSGFVQVPGPVSSFKTAPATALISAVSPAYTAVDAGQNVVLSAAGVSVTNYQWYKIGSPDVQLANGTAYTGVTTNTLTILDTQLGDEGNYYCVGSNSLPSSASNRDTGSGRVLTKRLTSDYPFEVMNVVDGNNVTPDVVGGFNMTMTHEAVSAGLPVLAADVAAAALGTYSLKFDNLDEATDPNGQYALISNDVAKYEDITIGVWVKYNGGVDWQRIYDFGKDTTDYLFLAPKAGGAGLRFAIKVNNSAEQLLNAPALTVGEWTYVAVTIGGDTGRLYVNGKLVDTNTGMTLNPVAVTQTHNLVGKSQWADAEFNGLVDDLKIYDYARSTVQIAKDYLGVKGEWVCNMELTALPYDFDGNCVIGLGDFAMFAATWLETNRITLP